MSYQGSLAGSVQSQIQSNTTEDKVPQPEELKLWKKASVIKGLKTPKSKLSIKSDQGTSEAIQHDHNATHIFWAASGGTQAYNICILGRCSTMYCIYITCKQVYNRCLRT